MSLKLKEKTDDEVEVKKQEAPKRSGRSIAELASLSTLSKEELAEANEDEDALETDVDDEYDGDNIENPEDDPDEYSEETDEEETEKKPEDDNDPPMEHYGKQLTFAGKPTPEDVFRFMFHHTYCSIVGVFAILIVIASVVMSVWSFTKGENVQGVIFIAIFLFFIINSPLSLKRRSKAQSQNMCTEEGTITYTFSEAGFDMTRQTEYAAYKYDRIMKVINGKTAYYIYLGKMRAFLAPKADLGENEEIFLQLMRENVKNFKG